MAQSQAPLPVDPKLKELRDGLELARRPIPLDPKLAQLRQDVAMSIQQAASRRLTAARNNLLGVFSFTATFPTAVEHSYCRFLVGVEQEAAARGYDLVLFTGSSPGGAQADAPGALDRVRLADGCLLLGRHVPAAGLRRLVDDGFPLVHLGRRNEPEGLPWVGADYVAASAEVVRHLAGLGHRRIVLVREDDDAPASTDRQPGFEQGLAASPGTAGTVVRTAAPAADLTAGWVRAQLAEGVTAFAAEETDTGDAWRALRAAVRTAGLTAPGDLSLALLGSPPADLAHEPGPTGFDIPRTELGAAAVRLLTTLLDGGEDAQRLVACAFRPGHTAGPPPAADLQAAAG